MKVVRDGRGRRLGAAKPAKTKKTPHLAKSHCIDCPPSVLEARALHTVPLTPPTAKIAPITLARHILHFNCPHSTRLPTGCLVALPLGSFLAAAQKPTEKPPLGRPHKPQPTSHLPPTGVCLWTSVLCHSCQEVTKSSSLPQNHLQDQS